MDVKKIDEKPEVILKTPLLNKGTAFTQQERDELGLNGFLPYQVSTIEQQVNRRYHNFLQQPNQLSKFIFLSSLQNRNEILFYRLVSEHIAEMLPYIYTPTVGDVSLQYSMLYKDHRGLYLSYPLKDQLNEIIDNLPYPEIDVIVVTDGERILGLGDVGVGGMAIPVGKLALYTIFAGIHPERTLPVFLDVGTNNSELLRDENYVGWRHERISGKEYDFFIDQFVKAIAKRYPKVLLQWEDFSKNNARPLLERYRDKILSFNDDIQGTAAVTLSAVLTASKMSNKKLSEQVFVIYGGGSAGLGICSHILEAIEIKEGISKEKAIANFYVIDIDGLILNGHKGIDSEQKKYAKDPLLLQHWQIQNQDHITLLEVVQNVKPTVLIGVSAQAGAFTQEVIETMSMHTERPLVLPLSNPTDKCEARPEDIIKWSKGQAIIATGSPFPAVDYQGTLYPIAQCNNVCIFPGMGLAAIAGCITKISNAMFVAAAEELSNHAPILRNSAASLFPSFNSLKEISKNIAFTVAKVAMQENHAKHLNDTELKQQIESHCWNPEYPIFQKSD